MNDSQPRPRVGDEDLGGSMGLEIAESSVGVKHVNV
jgi:hypothetical protein